MDPEKMQSRAVAAVVMVIIGVIMLAAVLVPIISDQEKNNSVELTNEVQSIDLPMAKVEDVTATFNGTQMTINGEVLNINNTRPITLSTMSIYWNTTKTQAEIYCYSSTGVQRITGVTSFTLTATGGSWTLEYDTASQQDQTATGTYGTAFAYNPEGDYVSIMAGGSTTKNLKVNSTDQIYSTNIISTTTQFFTIENGVATMFGGEEGSTSSAPVSFATQAIDGVENAIEIPYLQTSGISFVVKNGESDYTVHPYYVIVPQKVYGIDADLATAFTVAEIIPLMVAVGLVMGVVTLLIYNRNE